MTDEFPVLSPVCPWCGNPPLFLVGRDQAFCQDESCPCLTWNPLRSPEDLRCDAVTIEIPEEGES